MFSVIFLLLLFHTIPFTMNSWLGTAASTPREKVGEEEKIKTWNISKRVEFLHDSRNTASCLNSQEVTILILPAGCLLFTQTFYKECSGILSCLSFLSYLLHNFYILVSQRRTWQHRNKHPKCWKDCTKGRVKINNLHIKWSKSS